MSIAEQVNIDRETVRKIFNCRTLREEDVCKNGPKRAHSQVLPVREFLATKQITVLEQPAYSPDLAPNDFILFSKIKEILKERHFDEIDDLRSNTTAALKAIPQNKIQNLFDEWARRWHLCIAS
jgi:transposase